MTPDDLIITDKMQAIPISTLLAQRVKIALPPPPPATADDMSDLPLVDDTTIAAGKAYPTVKDPARDFYFPRFRIATDDDGQRRLVLSKQSPPPGAVASLQIDFAITPPPDGAGRPIAQVPQPFTLTAELGYSLLSIAGEAGSRITTPFPELFHPVTHIGGEPEIGTYRGVLPIFDMGQLLQIVLAITNPAAKADVTLRANVQVGMKVRRRRNVFVANNSLADLVAHRNLGLVALNMKTLALPVKPVLATPSIAVTERVAQPAAPARLDPEIMTMHLASPMIERADARPMVADRAIAMKDIVDHRATDAATAVAVDRAKEVAVTDRVATTGSADRKEVQPVTSIRIGDVVGTIHTAPPPMTRIDLTKIDTSDTRVAHVWDRPVLFPFPFPIGDDLVTVRTGGQCRQRISLSPGVFDVGNAGLPVGEYLVRVVDDVADENGNAPLRLWQDKAPNNDSTFYYAPRGFGLGWSGDTKLPTMVIHFLPQAPKPDGTLDFQAQLTMNLPPLVRRADLVRARDRAQKFTTGSPNLVPLEPLDAQIAWHLPKPGDTAAMDLVTSQSATISFSDGVVDTVSLSYDQFAQVFRQLATGMGLTGQISYRSPENPGNRETLLLRIDFTACIGDGIAVLDSMTATGPDVHVVFKNALDVDIAIDPEITIQAPSSERIAALVQGPGAPGGRIVIPAGASSPPLRLTDPTSAVMGATVDVAWGVAPAVGQLRTLWSKVFLNASDSTATPAYAPTLGEKHVVVADPNVFGTGTPPLAWVQVDFRTTDGAQVASVQLQRTSTPADGKVLLPQPVLDDLLQDVPTGYQYRVTNLDAAKAAFATSDWADYPGDATFTITPAPPAAG